MRSYGIESLEDRRLFAVDHVGNIAIPDTTAALSAANVQTILAQAASQSRAGQVAAVVDREGTVLGIIGKGSNDPAEQAIIVKLAIQRARTAAAFESTEDAFTTRTARFIIQNHFPQPVRNTPGGPLYGVEFSSFPGTDVLPPQYTLGSLGGISGDPGSAPLFLGGRQPVGGVGVAGDGRDLAPSPELLPVLRALRGTYGERSIPDKAFNGKEEKDYDEAVAFAAAQGFMAAKKIRATNVFVNGLRFPFAKSTQAKGQPTRDFATITGAGGGATLLADADAGLPTATVVAGTPRLFNGTVAGIPGTFRNRSATAATPPQEAVRSPNNDLIDSVTASSTTYPNLPAGRADPDLTASVTLTTADVMTVITNAVEQAKITRGGIREPDGSSMQIHIAVVDRDGDVLGVFRMADGTNFSYDVAVQKARTAAFFSDDAHAFSSRAIGFMSQKFFPPGIEKAKLTGPLFQLQDKLNIQIDTKNTKATADDGDPILPQLTNLPGTEVPNGITIFPGGAPLYKNGVFVGAVGISGDGVDQDDLAAFAGTAGFRPPDAIRSDRLPASEIVDFITTRATALANRAGLLVGPSPTNSPQDDPNDFRRFDPEKARARLAVGLPETRLPYVKFPRNPTEP